MAFFLFVVSNRPQSIGGCKLTGQDGEDLDDDDEYNIIIAIIRLNDAHNTGYTSKVQSRVQVVNDPLCGIRPQVRMCPGLVLDLNSSTLYIPYK